jgi:hypothetical protein
MMVIEVFCLGLPVVSCLSTPSRRRWKIFAIFHHDDADVDVVMGVVWCGDIMGAYVENCESSKISVEMIT